MREEIMALLLSLRPISHVVDTQNSERSGHSDQHTKPNEKPLQPFRTVIGLVYQASMHSQGMSQQKRGVAQSQE